MNRTKYILPTNPRAEDLVGKPAALERFTMELIQDPTPPVNWRQIYSIPLHQVYIRLSAQQCLGSVSRS